MGGCATGGASATERAGRSEAAHGRAQRLPARLKDDGSVASNVVSANIRRCVVATLPPIASGRGTMTRRTQALGILASFLCVSTWFVGPAPAATAHGVI